MKTINELWQQSQNDAEGMRLGYTTQQHYFAELVRADEREACAKVCDAEEETAGEETWYQCAKELAKQIRARGQA
jgi:hypothetical protein